MATPKTFYVLGAGASFGLVPTTAQLRTRVKSRYWALGSFPASHGLRTEMFQRVIGSIRDAVDVDHGEDPYSPSNLAEAFLSTIQPEVLDTIVRLELAVPIARVAPPQYDVFNASQRGTIFSFNLDGLARAYCSRRHVVLEPHGRIERELLRSPWFLENWEDLASVDLGVPNLVPKVLLRPEPHRLIESEVYRAAMQLFEDAPRVVFVGYSFSRFQSGRDDDASLYFFGELLRRHPKPVLIVDPAPDEVADLLSHAARRDLAIPLAAKWDLLSAAILIAVLESGYARIHHRSAKTYEVLRRYHALGG